MPKIYIVSGSTGEYSDRQDWLVAAYADEALARAHVEAAERWYKETGAFNLRRDRDAPKNPYDQRMEINYTGTSWHVDEVDLRGALPSFP